MAASPAPFATKDNASGLLSSGINAAALSIPLESGDGAAFPQPFSGVTTSLGSSTTLNCTGISATIGGSAQVGKLIWNKTDDSVAIITAVATDALTTTRLLGGTDQTWASGDTWAIDAFVATAEVVSTNAYGVQSTTQREEMLITARSTDTLTVPSGGRGYNGTVANTFSAGDSIFLHVTSPIVERLKDIVSVLAQQADTNVTAIDNIESGASFFATATGSSNAFAITLSPAPTAYAAGLAVRFKANHTITGAATLNVNGLGAVAIKKLDGATDLTAGDIKSGQLLEAAHDGTNFVMTSPQGQTAGSALSVDAKTADYTVLDTEVGKLFTNAAATRRIDLTLPSAVSGLNYSLAVHAAQLLVVRPASGDSLAVGSTVGAAAKPGFYSSTQYSTLQLAALDGDLWAALASTGTWTQEVLKGYYMGGTTGSVTAVIEDLNFSTETSAAIAATLNAGRDNPTGVSGRRKGYAMGGNNSGGSDVTAIDDLVFLLETSDVIAATLDTAKDAGAGVQSSTKGYMLGGETGANVDVIEDLNFDTEASAALVATLPTAKRFAAGVSSSVKGYAMGGFVGAATTEIAALTFSGESCAAIAATLNTARYFAAGAQSSTKGYHFGGNGNVTVIEDLTFSGEASEAISTTLGTGRNNAKGCSAPAKAYVLAGDPGPLTSIEAFVFSGETISTLAASLDSAKRGGAAVSAS